MKRFIIAALLVLSGCASSGTDDHKASSELAEPRTSDEAIASLEAGNSRFCLGHCAHPHCDVARIRELSKGQHPSTVVLACGDSRVAPELVLDEGLGDLFVLRVAGNVLEPSIVGSIEYAVEHLGSKLVLVLGHTGCGAVKAALAVHGNKAEHDKLGPNLGALVDKIEPVLTTLPPNLSDDERAAAAVRANATSVAKALPGSSAILKEALEARKIAIVAGVYDLASGKVELLR